MRIAHIRYSVAFHTFLYVSVGRCINFLHLSGFASGPGDGG